MNAIFTKLFTACALLCAGALLKAQPLSTCTGFENLPAGTYYNANAGYAPGDVFMQHQGVSASLGNFVYANGSTAFGDVAAQTLTNTLNPPFSLGQGTVLWTSNATATFQFPAGTTSVCFSFWAGGGVENISVNGHPLQVVNFPFNIPSNLAPGVTFTITPANPAGTVVSSGTMCLSGNIESLRIGGQEFFIDNLCYSPGTAACPQFNLQVTPLPCTPNGVFFAAVNPGIPASNIISGYRLFVNGALQGTYTYAQGSVNVGPFAGDGSIERTFVIQDLGNPDCRDTAVLAPIQCANTCGISLPLVEVVDCTPQGYTLRINFDFATPNAAQGFRVVAGGQTYGPFSAQQLPLILPNVQVPTDALEFEVQVCPITTLTVLCCRSVRVPTPQCPLDDCIGFEYLQGSAYGASQGNQPGDLIYTENYTTVRLLPYQDLDWVTAFDELRVEQAPGAPPFAAASGKFLLLRRIGLSFNFSQYPEPVDSVSVDFFNQGQVNIAANGGQLLILPSLGAGTYNLGQGITMQVLFTANTLQQGKLIFRGNIFSLRIGGAFLRIDNVCILSSPPCALTEPEYFDIACNDALTYNVRINFQRQGAGSSFQVKSRGGYVGQFAYADLPVLLTGIPVPNDLNDVLRICDSDPSNDCCIELPVQVPCLHDCRISEFRALALPCRDDGSYFVTFNFEHELTSPGFRLQVNGQPYGQYAYDQLPVTIGPFPGNGQNGLALRVEDNLFACVAETALPPVQCNPPACPIANLEAYIIQCSNTAPGYLYVNFNAISPSVDGRFHLYLSNTLFGTYDLSALPLMLPWPFLTPSPTAVVQVRVCLEYNPDCCAQTTVRRINCDNAECMAFEGLPPGFIYTAETGYEPGDLLFDDAGIPVTMRAYAGPTPVVPAPSVRVSTDHFGSAFTRASGQYIVLRNAAVEFDFEAPEQEVVSVCFDFFDGGGIENFSVNGQPLRFVQSLFQLHGQQVAPGVFLHIAPTPVNVATGRVCLSGPVRTLLIGGPQFGIDNVCFNTLPVECRIGELTATATPCEQGQYYVQLDFQHQHTGSQGFTVRGNGVQYGTFSYAELPILLGPFPATGTNPAALEFEVRDVQRPDCRAAVALTPPPCNGIVVWPGDADNNNIANHFDLLNIGVGYGFQGPPRTSTNDSWDGMPAQPWPQVFANAATNYAYADCDGNGVINAADAEVIRQNYGLTHGPVTPYVPLPSTPNNPALFVNMPDAPIPPGTAVSAPIILGRASLPVEAIYGLAFRIEFDPEVFLPNSVGVDFINSTWLAGNSPATASPLLHIDRSYAQDGVMEVAITRINRQNTGGFGPIAHFRGIIDDIAGIHSNIRITGIRAIRANETPLAIFNPVETFHVGDGLQDTGWLDMLLSLQVYPNPTGDDVFVASKYVASFDELRVFNDKGMQMSPAMHNSNRVSLAGLPSGVYFLRIRIGEHTFHKRVVKR